MTQTEQSNQDLITIVLPVFGRPEFLPEALSSVQHQSRSSWQLLIADDGSDETTQTLLLQWINRQSDERIHWVKRTRNLGLFANLNRALHEMDSEWALLLCSDDRLHPHAVETLHNCRMRWPEVGLILSTFDSINSDGSPRAPDNAQHHDQVSPCTALIHPEQFVPALLELGSLNGNLTGMALSRSLCEATGPFKEDWRHAADWEWLLRAAEQGPVVLNRITIAAVRTHEHQLSNSNRRSGHEVFEVAQVVGKLRCHPLLLKEARRHRWAAHVMQFQLWNVIKAAIHGQYTGIGRRLSAIQHSAGLLQTGIAFLRWIPQRWRQHRQSSAH